MLDILRLEYNLQKRVDKQPYIWNKKQDNSFDRKTRIIYKIRSYGELIETFKGESSEIKHYAYNRWLNFWSSQAVEQFFEMNQMVRKERNQYHKTVDFYINDIPFDHKTSIIPQSFISRMNEVDTLQFKWDLMNWLYNNQSEQQRKHLKNRLFVILVNTKNPKQSWKMKSELTLIQTEVDKYLDDLSNNRKRLVRIEEFNILSGILIIKK